jgi:predicted nucleic acid-binding protein
VQRYGAGVRIVVAKRTLLDTGFLVALVNKADRDHERCVEVWRELRTQLLSVDGVLVEAAHMLRKVPGAAAALVGLVFGAGTELIATTEERANRAVELMAKYADVPMDLVDALLVVVAEERNVRDVLTLDRRGFSAYRVGRERFRVMP